MNHLRPADPETVATLAAEQEAVRTERITGLARAMAERFDVSSASFSVLDAGTSNGAKTFYTVMYDEPLGLDLGDPDYGYDPKRSWNSIFHEETATDFMIEVGGKNYDTRKGMTEAVYRAFIAGAKRSRRRLPDSSDVRDLNRSLAYPTTWLTGEPGGYDKALVGSVFGLRRNPFIEAVDMSSRDIDRRFRPAVTIEE